MRKDIIDAASLRLRLKGSSRRGVEKLREGRKDEDRHVNSMSLF